MRIRIAAVTLTLDVGRWAILLCLLCQLTSGLAAPFSDLDVLSLIDPIEQFEEESEAKKVVVKSVFNVPIKASPSMAPCPEGTRRVTESGPCVPRVSGIKLDDQFLLQSFSIFNRRRPTSPSPGPYPGGSRRRKTTTTAPPALAVPTYVIEENDQGSNLLPIQPIYSTNQGPASTFTLNPPNYHSSNDSVTASTMAATLQLPAATTEAPVNEPITIKPRLPTSAPVLSHAQQTMFNSSKEGLDNITAANETLIESTAAISDIPHNETLLESPAAISDIPNNETLAIQSPSESSFQSFTITDSTTPSEITSETVPVDDSTTPPSQIANDETVTVTESMTSSVSAQDEVALEIGSSIASETVKDEIIRIENTTPLSETESSDFPMIEPTTVPEQILVSSAIIPTEIAPQTENDTTLPSALPFVEAETTTESSSIIEATQIVFYDTPTTSQVPETVEAIRLPAELQTTEIPPSSPLTFPTTSLPAKLHFPLQIFFQRVLDSAVTNNQESPTQMITFPSD